MPHIEKASSVEYDLSLRLWSDSISLESFALALRLSVKHLHVKGDKISDGEQGKERIASRHYVSTASKRVRTEHEVGTWLSSTLCRVEEAAFLPQPNIDTVFWIALFGPIPKTIPVPDSELIARVVVLNARILIENYSETSGEGFEQTEDVEFPPKTWYPALL